MDKETNSLNSIYRTMAVDVRNEGGVKEEKEGRGGKKKDENGQVRMKRMLLSLIIYPFSFTNKNIRRIFQKNFLGTATYRYEQWAKEGENMWGGGSGHP